MEPVLKRALGKCDVEYMDIRFEEKAHTNIRYNGPALDGIGTNYSRGGHIRALYKGGWGNATFNVLDQIERKAEEACRASRLCGRGASSLAEAAPVRDSMRQSLSDNPSAVSLDEKHDLIKRYNDQIITSAGIVSSIAEYEDSRKVQYFANTGGSYIEEESIHCGVSLLAAARDGSNVQDMYRTVHGKFGFDAVRHLENEINGITKDARDLVKAERLSGGIYTIVMDPQMSGLFIHEALGHLSEADHMFENERLRGMMSIGKRLGPDQLNVVDDATITGKSGQYCYDDEGVPAQRKHIVRDGKLVGRLHSRETAGKLDERPTGNARAVNFTFPPLVRMSCTFIEPGDYDVKKMIEEVPDGLYVVSAVGGMTHLEMFTFTAMKAYRIINGKIGPMVRDIVLTGNIFDTLCNIDAIGNDLMITASGGCGKYDQQQLPVSFGGPHIRIKNVLVGGK